MAHDLRRTRTGAAAAALALVIAACGSASDETAQTVTTTAAPLTTTTAAVTTTTTAPPETTSTSSPTTTAPPGPSLQLAFSNLPPLSGGAAYEGWLIVNDEPISTGRFDISPESGIEDIDGNPTNAFAIEIDPAAVSAVVISIEPENDTDPAPSATHILAGDVVDGVAELSIGHDSALGTNFVGATGEFVLATPTDGDRVNDEFSGVWFLVFPGPTAGLDLPVLPEGWTYEGWTVIDGTPVTTGTFRSAVGSDDAAPYSGTVRTPGFPGEDFLFNAPAGLTFPLDLSGSTVVVSVEPVPDFDAAPFGVNPLAGAIPPSTLR